MSCGYAAHDCHKCRPSRIDDGGCLCLSREKNMPKCGSCGTVYENPSDLDLVRNQANRWIPICRSCIEKGVDVDSVKAPAVVDESVVKEAAIEAPITVALRRDESGSDTFANIPRLLAALRSMRVKSEDKGRIREHERHSIELTILFRLARDDMPYAGLIKDMSQGGLLMRTRRALSKGQILHFDWNVPLPPSVTQLLQSAAEVRRVAPTENGWLEVGLRFVQRQLAKEANRRRFRRYKCEMDAYYQREGSEVITRGHVRDISQGGGQFFLCEALEVGEVIHARLVGNQTMKGDLVGTVKVCRVMQRGPEFETGCAFIKMVMEKHMAAPSDSVRLTVPGGSNVRQQ